MKILHRAVRWLSADRYAAAPQAPRVKCPGQHISAAGVVIAAHSSRYDAVNATALVGLCIEERNW